MYKWHGLAVPRAGYMSHVTGSFHGESDRIWRILYNGRLLIRSSMKLASQFSSITNLAVQFSVQYNLKLPQPWFIYLFAIQT